MVTDTVTVHMCVYQLPDSSTGWGKITSLHFKVNNKKPIRDIKILFLDSEITIWEVLNHIVLKEYLASGGRCLHGVCVQSAWETAKRTV